MPTISLTELAKISGKLIVIALLSALIIGFIGSLINTFTTIIQHLTGATNSVNGLNLGWFASAIGLTDFLNALMQSLYVAGGIFLSGIITIYSFKTGMKFYNNLLKV